MNRLTIVRCFQVILLSIAVGPAVAQEKRPIMPSSPQDLMIRLLSARESIVQYAVEVNISEKTRRIGEKDWVAPPKMQDIKMYLEYSKMDDHFVVAVWKSPRHDSYEGWVISGRSKDIYYTGSYRSLCMEDYAPGKLENYMVPHFDPMNIGFMFCISWFSGIYESFETYISKRIKYMNQDPNPFKIRQLEDGTIECIHTPPHQPELYHIDPARDYWVVYSEVKEEWAKLGRSAENDFSVETTVSLEKRGERYLPNLVQMFCKSKGVETYYLVSLKWESVNQPMSAGRDCGPRLLERLGGGGKITDLTSDRK